ncbi:hypothetical protein A6302_02822 [Methylobrevis pamukkalensis]|uniref:Uncharacterized protein n=1 Tax=Methylobrevis pamukkalensis TaxID=1439726 RepID=A0A1E3H262_9HYPH|nr:hypothetical protein A6302_02822 [Methylobrevis pamukkalensis]
MTNRNTAISTAVAGEATARGTAISGAIATEVTNRNTAISAAVGPLQTQITARDDIINDQIGRAPHRPGDAPNLWSTVSTGAARDRPPLEIGEIVTNSVLGRALRISGDDVDDELGYVELSPRLDFDVTSGETYRIKGAFARAVNPAEPGGASVELWLRLLDGDHAPIDGGKVQIGPTWAPVVTDGAVRPNLLVGMTGALGELDYPLPATVRYVVPIVRIYGTAQATDFALLSIANALLVETDVAVDDLRTQVTGLGTALATTDTRLTTAEDLLLGTGAPTDYGYVGDLAAAAPTSAVGSDVALALAHTFPVGAVVPEVEVRAFAPGPFKLLSWTVGAGGAHTVHSERVYTLSAGVSLLTLSPPLVVPAGGEVGFAGGAVVGVVPGAGGGPWYSGGSYANGNFTDAVAEQTGNYTIRFRVAEPPALGSIDGRVTTAEGQLRTNIERADMLEALVLGSGEVVTQGYVGDLATAAPTGAQSGQVNIAWHEAIITGGLWTKLRLRAQATGSVVCRTYYKTTAGVWTVYAQVTLAVTTTGLVELDPTIVLPPGGRWSVSGQGVIGIIGGGGGGPWYSGGTAADGNFVDPVADTTTNALVQAEITIPTNSAAKDLDAFRSEIESRMQVREEVSYGEADWSGSAGLPAASINWRALVDVFPLGGLFDGVDVKMAAADTPIFYSWSIVGTAFTVHELLAVPLGVGEHYDVGLDLVIPPGGTIGCYIAGATGSTDSGRVASMWAAPPTSRRRPRPPAAPAPASRSRRGG